MAGAVEPVAAAGAGAAQGVGDQRPIDPDRQIFSAQAPGEGAGGDAGVEEVMGEMMLNAVMMVGLPLIANTFSQSKKMNDEIYAQVRESQSES